MFSLHENLWPGMPPDPPNDIFRVPPKEAANMARPRKPDAERRSRTIGVRVTTAEAAEIAERAGAARLTMGGYMRRRALGRPGEAHDMQDFTDTIRTINSTFRQLREMDDPFRVDQVPSPVPTGLAGVYSLSDADRTLYVGRTRNLRDRLSAHRSSAVRRATLAVKMARLHSNLPANYRPNRSAPYLHENDSRFRAEFDKARERIRGLQVRYVVERDAVRRALLEIYAAIQLDTVASDATTHPDDNRYNSFEEH